MANYFVYGCQLTTIYVRKYNPAHTPCSLSMTLNGIKIFNVYCPVLVDKNNDRVIVTKISNQTPTRSTVILHLPTNNSENRHKANATIDSNLVN